MARKIEPVLPASGDVPATLLAARTDETVESHD